MLAHKAEEEAVAAVEIMAGQAGTCADAGTLIAELTAYMEFRAASEDIARTCHAHPTLSEAIKEAALSVDKDD
ncbi:hypothetical protein TNIN_220371 [Trichonephila inaurata madagascariensis]|uniref:Pyridine nucleotide-disulphide oxidoreductase dimerisation domain-containing protein n=1 Tax=Trichonephila inaurata madagascariensis TaxID=2747483 RepID=A0A8X6XP91_9ARAC|nr:hypothetical protein TNIN_220371 [Trichonephila inaurata madagascariensis]